MTPYGMTKDELAEFLEGEPAYRVDQVWHGLYELGQRWEEMTNLPRPLRERLQKSVKPALDLTLESKADRGTTVKWLWSLPDRARIETVLMPEGERNTLCISSQVGCPVACRFCLTALMGLERNLTAGEIVGQVLFVLDANSLSADVNRLNIVMMGQGEPLLNLPEVLKATRILVDRDGIGFSERRITVSTAGILPKIEELGRAEIRPKLAISLNASTEEQRRELMPITKKYHLRDLLEVCRRFPLRTWEKLTFEYVLLAGVNDTDADARRVAKMLANLNAKVNLIALNPGPGIPYGTPTAERVSSFQAIVRRSVPCFVRKPRGRDVYAACGQLKRMESEGLVEVGRAPTSPTTGAN